MKGYQLKAVIKKTKPPMWKRFQIPAGITFAQLSIVLEEILEQDHTDRYEFEFFQGHVHLREWRGKEKATTKYDFDYKCSADTFIDLLFDKEKWFTFRAEDYELEYRVTIEKCLEDMEFDYPIIIKQTEDSQTLKWTELEEQNLNLKKLRTVKYGEPDYRSHTEIVKELEKKVTAGLQGSHEAVSREERNKKSAFTVLNEFAQQFSKMIANKEIDMEKINMLMGQNRESIQEEAPESRYPKVKEQLLYYEKKDLWKMAEELHLLRYKSLTKDDLAEKIKNEILRPSVMKNRMLILQDEDMDAFEEAISSDCGYYPEEASMKRLEKFFNIGYLVIYRDDYVEVPDEVVKIYQRINTTDFQTLRRKVSWMYECLRITNYFYTVAPVRIVYRMYRKRQDYRVSFDEFLEIFNQVPEERNPCLICGDKIIDKVAFKNDLYLNIERSQEGKEFYIPDPEEVLDYAEHGYPSQDLHYQKLKTFLREKLGIKSDDTEDLMRLIWNVTTWGKSMSFLLDELKDYGAEIPDDVFEQFESIMMDVNNNTRMHIYRGHTPLEIVGSMAPHKDGQQPAVVPMCSMAAGMSKEDASNADDITVALMPNGMSGEAAGAHRKIYPNDPCPCGSGKKYKKCCGRK